VVSKRTNPLSQGDGVQIGWIGRGIGGHGYSGQ